MIRPIRPHSPKPQAQSQFRWGRIEMWGRMPIRHQREIPYAGRPAPRPPFRRMRRLRCSTRPQRPDRGVREPPLEDRVAEYVLEFSHS
jgi:hypothetical protein